MNSDCIFCKIINKKIPANVAFEDKDIIAFHDINPAADIHLVVLPKKHIETLNALKDEDIPLVGKIFLVIKDLALKHGISGEGYRVVANCNKNAGQEIFHIHFHLLGGRRFKWPPG
jgi:histidine triad (HIT) family protein